MHKSFACLPENTKGRRYQEPPSSYRNHFARDRDRIIHSNAFKRLQYKTQVFINHEGDHFRNRLTHSIEVATIARSTSCQLGLVSDLAEAIALAHDLGHTPFGHSGEDALNKCMESYGGFSHNAHSFKILTFIEQRYASFDGLNLSWEMLEGVVKHNGPISQITRPFSYVSQYNAIHDLDLSRHSSAEAQVASLSDDIAYICHDLEDGITAQMFTCEELKELILVGEFVADLQKQYPDVEDSRIIYEAGRKLIHYFVHDLLEQTEANINKYNIKTVEDVRSLGQQLVAFSDEVVDQIRIIKEFLTEKVYKHPKVAKVNFQCHNIVKGLFSIYTEDPNLLPTSWRKIFESSSDKNQKMLIIADYIAGMTDRFAIKQYQSFLNININNISL